MFSFIIFEIRCLIIFERDQSHIQYSYFAFFSMPKLQVVTPGKLEEMMDVESFSPRNGDADVAVCLVEVDVSEFEGRMKKVPPLTMIALPLRCLIM